MAQSRRRLWRLIMALVLIACASGAAAPAHSEEQRPYPDEVIVKEDDTLSEISQRVYGTTRHWKKIARWNGIRNINRLKPGRKLVLKDPTDGKTSRQPETKAKNEVYAADEPSLQSAPPAETPKDPAPATPVETPLAEAPAPVVVSAPLPMEEPVVAAEVTEKPKPEPRTSITVEQDDTLFSIATRLYGKPGRWKRIAEWNNLASPALLRVGMRLKLKQPPTLTDEEGKQELLKVYRKRFDQKAPQLTDEKLNNKAAVVALKVEQEKVQEKYYEKVVVKATDHFEKDEVRCEDFFKLGKAHYDKQQYNEALPYFHRCRESEQGFVGSWFYEVLTLRALGRKDEEAAVTVKFLDLHPQYKSLPMFQQEGQQE